MPRRHSRVAASNHAQQAQYNADMSMYHANAAIKAADESEYYGNANEYYGNANEYYGNANEYYGNANEYYGNDVCFAAGAGGKEVCKKGDSYSSPTGGPKLKSFTEWANSRKHTTILSGAAKEGWGKQVSPSGYVPYSIIPDEHAAAVFNNGFTEWKAVNGKVPGNGNSLGVYRGNCSY